jgi:hypothetical protein
MADITWKDFYDLIRLEANKGSTLDELIPLKVFQAVRSLEQNESFKWNEKLLQAKIDSTLDNPYLLELPSDFKSPITLNISTTEFGECMDTLEMQDPEDFAFGSEGSPAFGYWLQNNRWIWLPKSLADGTSVAFWYNAFTLKSEMAPELTSPILRYGQEALLGLTMQSLAATCREPTWRELYEPLASIGIKTLHVADAELRRASATGSFGGLRNG